MQAINLLYLHLFIKITFIQNTFIINNFIHVTINTILNILVLTLYLFFESSHVMTLLRRERYFTSSSALFEKLP